jgi:lipoprotein-releasing system permease protein
LIIKFAYRYLVSKKSTNAINIIAWVSITAITLVTAAMIIILSVFNGLSDLVKSLYTGFYSDIKITATNGKIINIAENKLQELSILKNVAIICKIAEEKALIKTGENQTVVTLKGVDSNYTKISNIAEKVIRKGPYDLGTLDKPNLILGYGVESALNIVTGPLQTPLTTYIPNRNQRFTGKMEDFNVGVAQPISTFAIQQEFDNKYVLTNLAYAKSLIGLDSNTVTQLEISLLNKDDYKVTQKRMQQLLGDTLIVANRFEQNKSLYSVMRNEKWATYAIFCLVLFIASFTIIGALTMLVLEKKKDISVLRSLGSNSLLIKNIFLSEGFLLGVIGVVLGSILGLLLCFLQAQFHLIKLGGGSFLIDYYPVKVLALDVLLIGITVLVITTIAGYFPALKASKQQFELKN